MRYFPENKITNLSYFVLNLRSNVIYGWFAGDVMAPMLMIRNKSVSLLWELNSIFMQILQNKLFIVLATSMAAL